MVATYFKVDQLDNFNRLTFSLMLSYNIKSFDFILKLDALKQNFRWQLQSVPKVGLNIFNSSLSAILSYPF